MQESDTHAIARTAGTGTHVLARLESRALAPKQPAPPRAWAEAAGALVVVCAVGALELVALDMPQWVGVPFVLVAVAIAFDRIRLARRPRGLDAETAEAPRGLPEPAPTESWSQPAAAVSRAELLARRVVEPRNDVRAEQLARRLDAAARASRPIVAPRTGDLNGYADIDGNGNGNGHGTARAIGYTCVPALPDGAALAADVDDITRWCGDAGIAVAKIVHDVDGQTGKSGGPALQWALQQVAEGEAGALVIARLRNLSPTVAGMSPLLRWFIDPARRLVAIEEEIDTGTEAGRLAATALASVGVGENERLSERTRRGLEAARSRGKGRAGAAVSDVPGLRERILQMRSEGMTLQAIADTLNDEGVPTLRGGAKWRPSSVHTATGYRRPAPGRGIRPPEEKRDS